MPTDHEMASQIFEFEIFKSTDMIFEKRLYVFGVLPSRAEVGYGYIQIERTDQQDFPKVTSFIEKPSKRRKIYDQQGYFWNAGIFFSSFFIY